MSKSNPYSLKDWQLRLMDQKIREHGCRHVLECGSGRSTVLFDSLIEEGAIASAVALEHLPNHPEKPTQWVEVLHFPIRDRFYDLSDFSPSVKFDCLLIDGPPCYSAALPTSREFALERCAPFLSDGALIVIDDVHQAHIRRYLYQWVGLLSSLSIVGSLDKSMAIATYKGEKNGTSQHIDRYQAQPTDHRARCCP